MDVFWVSPSMSRKRQLLGTAFGFPGGFAWALMAAREAGRGWGVPGIGGVWRREIDGDLRVLDGISFLMFHM